MNQSYHVPVLLRESVDGMNIRPDAVCVDVTFGGGGHTHEILSRLQGMGRLYSFDQDEDVLAHLPSCKNFTFVRSNFRYLKNFVRYYGDTQIDALLADLGVSSHHFDDSQRGFSFRFENGQLDMRMNRQAEKSALSVLNDYSEERLADIFYLYGELRQSRSIASAVVRKRQNEPIRGIADFLEVMRPFVHKDKEKKMLAQAFQALRIEVNEEMEALREMLVQAEQLLRPDGRISVITYHSLEDRLVKNFFKTGNFEGKVEKDFFGNPIAPLRPVNSKVIVPSADEMAQNPRSRSAKLRIAEKKID